jgi:hypothetical protein
MKKLYALLFCFLMISSSLIGCFGEDESEGGDVDESEGWNSADYPIPRVEIEPPVLIAQ